MERNLFCEIGGAVAKRSQFHCDCASSHRPFSLTLIGHPQKLRLWQLFGGQSYVRKKKRLVSGGSRSACREQSLNTHIYIRRKKERMESKVTGCQSLCDQRAAALDFLSFLSYMWHRSRSNASAVSPWPLKRRGNSGLWSRTYMPLFPSHGQARPISDSLFTHSRLYLFVSCLFMGGWENREWLGGRKFLLSFPLFLFPGHKILRDAGKLKKRVEKKGNGGQHKKMLAPAISWNLRSQESVGRCFRIPWIGTTSWPPRFLRIQFLFSFFCGPAPKVLYAGPRKRKGNCNRNCSDKLSDWPWISSLILFFLSVPWSV